MTPRQLSEWIRELRAVLRARGPEGHASADKNTAARYGDEAELARLQRALKNGVGNE